MRELSTKPHITIHQHLPSIFAKLRMRRATCALMIACACFLLFPLVFMGCEEKQNAKTTVNGRNPSLLKIALLPDQNPAVIIKKHRGFKQYLEEKLGKRIDFFVSTDYNSLIEAMRRGKIDIAYLGPLTYIIAKKQCELHGFPISPFAIKQFDGSNTYRSVIIANTDANIHTIEDVKNKVVAFGDRSSTSSHLIPRYMLAQSNLKFRSDYNPIYVGKHDAVARTVESGQASVGALNEYIFNSLLERKIIHPDRIKVIATSKPFQRYPWVMIDNLDETLKLNIKAAFYELDDPELLKDIQADRLVPITDEKYDIVRELIQTIDFDLSSL